MNDFVVVGGGVIGMLTALELADGGAEVTLVERGQCGREASWAGGGIVSPLYPWRYSAPISRLSAWSEGFYPTLAERLIETTGIDPEYRQQGLLYLNVEDAEQALAWSREYAKPLTRVDADFVYDKAPAVASGCESALWMPTLGSIRNPRLGKSLRAALDAHPRVRLLENVAVQAEQIFVLRVLRHRLGGSLHMHHHIWHLTCCDQRKHFGVPEPGTDVIDHGSSGV